MRQPKPFFERLKKNLIPICTAVAVTVDPSFAQEESGEGAITSVSLEERSRRLFETREAIARERAAWAEQKPLFENLITLREKEISEIDEFTAVASERVEEVTRRRAELVEEEAERKAWRASFSRDVSELESSMRQVLPLLPRPVKDKVGDSISRLNIEGAEELPLQERFRDVLTVLSAAREFDARLTIDSEIREFEGQRHQVDVLYLGLDHAWFVDESGGVAGVGVPSPTGWIWETDDTLAPAIRTAIDINRREAPPAMVSLPFPPKTASTPASASE